ncbi:MAG: amino acid permease, partial [Duncaniella sp.]|nr:amino acid permease [Duncaniella sp.]
MATSTSPRSSSDKPQVKKPSAALISTGAMTVMIITTVVSLRGLPSQAEFGIQSIFYYLFAAIVFLIPFSLVCAELASTYTHSGGLYRWVSEAFGPRWGWTAMYLEWQTLVIWFPAVLMFAAVSLAYIFWPESFDAKLSANK